MSRCYHLQYEGGSEYNCYYCDLCHKHWDWNDAEVEHLCKVDYEKCPVWQKYS